LSQLTVNLNARTQDGRLTRGGPSMEKPKGWRTVLLLQNSTAAQNRGETQATYGRDEDGGLTFSTYAMVTMQPRPRWQFSVRPSYERLVDTQQYVTALAGGSAATFGRRFIFAHIDRSTYSTQVRMNYTFKPDLTLDF